MGSPAYPEWVNYEPTDLNKRCCRRFRKRLRVANQSVSWIRLSAISYVSRVTPEKPTDDDETRPLELPEESAPVFVDSTGRRGRRIRFAFYGIGGLSLTYAGMVAMSLAGGPLNPETLLPFPDLLINRPAAESTPGLRAA